MASFTGSTGPDTFLGTDTEADVFRFTASTLQPIDTVSGGGGGFEDVLRLSPAIGGVTAAAFANVTGIERIDLADAGIIVILPAALVASAGGTLIVNGGAGTDSIVATALLGTTLALVVTTGSGGADLITTGDGADQVTLQGPGGGRSITLNGGDDTVTAALATLSGADTIQGGTGRDRLVLTGTGAALATALAGVTGFEEIQLANVSGVTLQVSDALVNGADGDLLTVIGNGQDQGVDASAVLAGRGVTFLAGAGADSFTGGAGADLVETSGTVSGTLGAGADTLRLLSASAAASALSGGSGNDTILVTKKGDWVLGAGLTGFETVELLAARIRLTLNATEGLEVLGSAGADYVVLGAARQAFYGFEGDDTVVLTAAMLPGVVLNGGGQSARDTIILTGGGALDLRRAFVTGFERLEVETGGLATEIYLGNQAMDVVLRGAADVTLGANAGQSLVGSTGNDRVTLGQTGQIVATRGGDDAIVGTAATLGAGTMVDGGGGFDRLILFGTGTVDLRSGALVQNVERIEFSGLSLVLDATPGLEVQGGGANDTVSALLADLSGNLSSGDDVLELGFDALFAPEAPGIFGGSSGNDTLRLVDNGGAPAAGTLPARFTSFETLDLGAMPAFKDLTIAGTEARTILYGNAVGLRVRGGEGNETFQMGTNAAEAYGNGGNDTILGAGGDDYLDGGAGHDSLNGAAGDDEFAGGLGRDTMRGGAGNDTFYIADAAELADWVVNPRTIIGSEPGAIDQDTLVIRGSGTMSLDLTPHAISGIDWIRIDSGVNLTLTLSDAMVATADASGVGFFGRLLISDYLFGAGNLVINAAALTAGRAITTIGNLAGNDSMLGGLGDDNLSAAGGNDTLKGGGGSDTLRGEAGNDELRGEAGNDSISGGAGADSIWGDDGGDRIALGAGDGVSDRVAYNSPTNGSVDINTTVDIATADLITEFTPKGSVADTVGDWIAISVAGLGLNGGANEKVLALNETWDASLYSVFVLNSLDTLGNSATATDFGSFQVVADGVNGDGGLKTGFTAGRTVIFAISNGELVANRQTGVYRWSDDGDGILEAGDDLRLLAVIDAVSTVAFSTETIVLA